MKCPKCSLINPESAERCDCGYDFASGESKKPYAGRQTDSTTISTALRQKAKTLGDVLRRRSRTFGCALLLLVLIVFVLGFVGSRNSTLEKAAGRGKYWKVRALLFLGANPNQGYGSGPGGPLHAALEGGHRDIAGLLIAKGADLEAYGGKPRYDTPLFVAARRGEKDMVEFLLAKGADVNGLKWYRGLPLYMAIKEGHKDVVAVLVAKGADLNIGYRYADGMIPWQTGEDHGLTPLHVAAWEGETEIASLLISKGVDVNAKDKAGRTPLHTAASAPLKREYKLATVEMLLAEGADVNARSNGGRTPLDCATRKAGTSPLSAERM